MSGHQNQLRKKPETIVLLMLLLLSAGDRLRADWPMLRGNSAHDGYAQFDVRREYHPAWVIDFENERLGTATEPIVVGDKVYVTTHAGSVYALRTDTGEPVWRFSSGAPILQSPAVACDVVVFSDTAGRLFGLDCEDGKCRWMKSIGGCGSAAAPVVHNGRVFICNREGVMVAVDARTGQELWRRHVGAPTRQTAAVAGDRVIVTSEDLRVVALAASNGEILWRSKPLAGQTARDYYPVVVQAKDRTYVIVRTNPAHNFAERISRDRRFLAQQAGADDSHWQKLDAWLKSEAARGSPELWEREQHAVQQYLLTNRMAQTFFVLDACSGDELGPAPVLWAAGCQGVGAPPARTSDGRLLVFCRSAYGNWNLGVAPMVGLLLFDLDSNRATPLFHKNGAQPPWNTFWGTADESQHFLVAGNTVLIVHQGTLSGFDLASSNLFRIHGDRDSYGGLPNPPWARNEWHGPARGGVALGGDRIYWQTGSRVICLAPGRGEARPNPRTVRASEVRTMTGPVPAQLPISALRSELWLRINEFFQAEWAPLVVEPGLAGRQFFFDNTREVIEALSWAYPHLGTGQQAVVRKFLADQFDHCPPFSDKSVLPLNQGVRREWYSVPPDSIHRVGHDRQPHLVVGVYSAWLYGTRCGEMDRVLNCWSQISQTYRDFAMTGWKLDSAKGDVYANRYLRALLAVEKLASLAGDNATEEDARARFETNFAELVAWWKRVAEEGTMQTFRGVSELDRFIGHGNGLSLRIAPHCHKVALIDGLSPELAMGLRERAAHEVERVWHMFERLYATWWLMGEERQVHFGENYIDTPDLAAGAFAASAWLICKPLDDLASRIDLPFCKADLFHLMKLSIALDMSKDR